MFSKKFLLSQVFFLIIAGLLIFFYINDNKKILPIYGKINDFNLIDTNNDHISLTTFEGKIWVADFIFTTCSGICPTMTGHLKDIYDIFMINNNVRFVSISVNPENDTPDRLKSYAEKYNINTQQWFFLTGKREDIQKIAVESFKLGKIDEPVFHSSYFTLIDKQGNIRGYYDGLEKKNIQKIINDINILLKE